VAGRAALPVVGRTVLVVDDILDEGVTMAEIVRRLLEQGASEVLSAVFADKDLGRGKPISRRFRRRASAEPLCLRLRHGRQGCLAQPAGRLCGKGL
jgi:orotate phosphoribosyltransferase